ncbi:MAG: hypothetical protein MZV70_37800 [Desulfobacterales bacterium]|nr:hypothetical protein [Desulfobacterales bacterium]
MRLSSRAERTRFSDTPKQYLSAGRGADSDPHAAGLRRLRGRSTASSLVVPPADIAFVPRRASLPPPGLRKACSVVAGGPRRQDSVFNGLAAIDAG